MKISNRQANKRLRAQLASLRSTLQEIPPSDQINRMSVIADIKRLEKELEKASSEAVTKENMDDQYIELAISGDPVIAQKGIDIVFAGKLITDFQSLVSGIVASRQGKTASIGPIKHFRQSNLHITGIVRGSFGFIIEPIARQRDLFELETAKAINLAAEMLVAISEPEGDLDDPVLADVSDRVLIKLSNMMNHLSSSNATLSIATQKINHTLTESTISSSIEKLNVTEIKESVVSRAGILNGILPENHKFELLVDQDEVINGNIVRQIPADKLKEWQNVHLDRKVSVKLRQRIIIRKGEKIRTSYALISIE